MRHRRVVGRRGDANVNGHFVEDGEGETQPIRRPEDQRPRDAPEQVRGLARARSRRARLAAVHAGRGRPAPGATQTASRWTSATAPDNEGAADADGGEEAQERTAEHHMRESSGAPFEEGEEAASRR